MEKFSVTQTQSQETNIRAVQIERLIKEVTRIYNSVGCVMIFLTFQTILLAFVLAVLYWRLK